MAFLFALDLVLVLGFAYALTAVLRPPTRPAFLVSGFVLVWADLVFTAEILSLLHLVTPGGMLAAHAILALGAVLIWGLRGRPRPPRFSLPTRSEITGSLKSWPDLWTLGLAVGLGYALLALINILVPPNNLDSLVYHLTKVAYWIQHKTLAPWPTPCFHQTLFPFNAEIGNLESMVFLRSDLLAGFVQWFSALGSMTAVFGLARVFGSSRAQAAFASCLYLSLPMIILQATTTQTDLTTAAMITAMAFLLLLGLRTKHQGLLILSGAALGLALGTKLTVFMILPGFVIGLAYVVLGRRGRPVRLLLVWAGACLAGFVLLGAFNYVQNWVYIPKITAGPPEIAGLDSQRPVNDRKSPAQPQPPVSSEQNLQTDRLRDLSLTPVQAGDFELQEASQARILNQKKYFQIRKFGGFDPTLIRYNIARDVFSFLDFAGLPSPWADSAARLRASIGRTVGSSLLVPKGPGRVTVYSSAYDFQDPRPRANEASSFFGPLGFFVWLPLVLYWSVAGFIKRNARLIPALSFIGFMILLSASQFWHPFRGRYYCLAVALCAPLVASLCSRGRLRGALRVVISLLAIMVMVVTILTNIQKPLVGPKAIWGKTRQERRTVLWGSTGIPARIVYNYLPRQVSAATILRSTDPEYIWFGENLNRTLTPIFPPPTVVDRDWLQKNTYDVVVVNSAKICRVDALPPKLFKVYRRPPYTIVVRVK
jgi:hypothetical protein